MSGSRQLAEHFADLLAPAGPIEIRRFFGGWGLRSAGCLFAVVMETLYFRVEEPLRTSLANQGSTPFTYGSRGKRITVERFYSAPSSALDDSEALCGIAKRALQGRGSADRVRPGARLRTRNHKEMPCHNSMPT